MTSPKPPAPLLPEKVWVFEHKNGMLKATKIPVEGASEYVPASQLLASEEKVKNLRQGLQESMAGYTRDMDAKDAEVSSLEKRLAEAEEREKKYEKALLSIVGSHRGNNPWEVTTALDALKGVVESESEPASTERKREGGEK